MVEIMYTKSKTLSSMIQKRMNIKICYNQIIAHYKINQTMLMSTIFHNDCI